MVQYKVAIVGGGVLGCSIAYFLASSLPPGSVTLLEQEAGIAFHASSRNTGKVHAPFLYDPTKKRLFARAAYLGFEMWKKYAAEKRLPFKNDGVLEVATEQRGIARLQKYMKWGAKNGLRSEELQFLESSDVRKLEPNVACEAALFCSRDASVDYAAFTRSLADDCRRFGVTILLGRRVAAISTQGSCIQVTLDDGGTIGAEFLVNAAGGNAIAIARLMDLAREFSALHFRGEYWRAPLEYEHLTRNSIYSVPKHPEYPFLDPHWVVRFNGQIDVGPNAVPVSGPEAYDWSGVMRRLPVFVFDLVRAGALRIFLDPEFLGLAAGEWETSLSKNVMIGRVREFLPQVDPDAFTMRGFAGIRSVLVDRRGKLQDDAVVLHGQSSQHILNYNSPGATGALPMGAMIASQALEKLSVPPQSTRGGLWDLSVVAASMAH